jgi:hypothetical protein
MMLEFAMLSADLFRHKFERFAMHRFVRGLLFASATPFLVVPPAIMAPLAAQAQSADISFDSFHDQLSNYGDWLYSDRWGEVWRPYRQDQDADWRPYSVGHWVYTSEYGWTWISDEGPWGDIAYHYGRWVYDPDDGWLWLTGYVWSPAWVVWRSAGPNVGWMPMPPDDDFLGGGSGLSVNVSFGDWSDTGGFYGYGRWYGQRFDENRFGALWTFVPSAHVADPVYRNYVVPRPQVVNIVRVSHNVTNYTVVNNVIINKSVNITMVQGAGGRPVVPVHAAAVLHTTRWVAPVTRGQQVQVQMRQVHPRGNGLVNSAPQPTAQQIRNLSTRPVPVRGPAAGGQPHHLFSQANAGQIQARRPEGGMTGPGNAQGRPVGATNAPMPANNPAFQRPAAAPQREMAPAPGAGEATRPPREQFDRAPGGHPNPGPAMNDTMRPVREERANPPPPPPEVRAPRPAETMRQPPPRPPAPPRPAPPRPAPHPQADRGGPGPEHHDGDRKPEH